MTRKELGGLVAVALAVSTGLGLWAWQRIETAPPPAAASNEPLPPRVLGFRLNVERTGENVFTFARHELEAALKDPYQLTHLGRIAAAPDGNGVEIVAAPKGSLTQRLGFEAGDVIQSVNGERVASPRELGRIYLRDMKLPRASGQVRRGPHVLTFSYEVR